MSDEEIIRQAKWIVERDTERAGLQRRIRRLELLLAEFLQANGKGTYFAPEHEFWFRVARALEGKE